MSWKANLFINSIIIILIIITIIIMIIIVFIGLIIMITIERYNLIVSLLVGSVGHP